MEVSELIPTSSPCESHMSLLMTLFMPFVTFDYVASLRF
jgi:hypothetical protein